MRSFSRTLAVLAPRRGAFRYVALVVGAMLFCAALYHTLNPSYLTRSFPRPPHSLPEKPPDAKDRHNPWDRHGDNRSTTTPEEWRSRTERVKQAFLHAYHGYEQHAAPHDELKSLTNRSMDK